MLWVPLVSPASTHTTFLLVLSALASSRSSPGTGLGNRKVWKLVVLLQEILTQSLRGKESRGALPCCLWWVGVAEVSAGPLLAVAGRPSVQGRTGEHCAALRSKGSEYIWHHGRISETEC